MWAWQRSNHDGHVTGSEHFQNAKACGVLTVKYVEYFPNVGWGGEKACRNQNIDHHCVMQLKASAGKWQHVANSGSNINNICFRVLLISVMLILQLGKTVNICELEKVKSWWPDDCEHFKNAKASGVLTFSHMEYLPNVVWGGKNLKLPQGYGLAMADVNEGCLYNARDEWRWRLCCLVHTNRRAAVVEITDHFNAVDESNVSWHTIHWKQLNMGLHSCRPFQVPMLTPVHH